MDDRELQALRDALKVSPENLPLRCHLAETLRREGLFEEALEELRIAARQAPHDGSVRLSLAEVCLLLNKRSQALVIVEDMIRKGERAGPAHLLHARILLAQGQGEEAAREYRRALDEDPDLVDAELGDKLGVVQDEPEFAETIEGRMRHMHEGGEAESGPMPIERPSTTFDDVGGLEDLKEEIRMKVIHPLNHQELFQAYGKSIGGGVLLYGPPGCGKTHLARATAGEVSAAFLSVGIHDVLDMWIGQSEQRMHALFQSARVNTPCVLFFDEVDALGAKRTDMQHSGSRHVINQFLAELDGVESNNDGILVLAATNSPWHLDAAFRRPGRFDRVIFVPPPDQPGRVSILQVLCRDKPVGEIDFVAVAKKCDLFSGADLKAVIDVAVEAKISEAMRTGRPEPLTTKDLLTARKKVRPSTREWFQAARNYALYSNEGGIYDDLLPYIDRG